MSIITQNRNDIYFVKSLSSVKWKNSEISPERAFEEVESNSKLLVEPLNSSDFNESEELNFIHRNKMPTEWNIS